MDGTITIHEIETSQSDIFISFFSGPLFSLPLLQLYSAERATATV